MADSPDVPDLRDVLASAISEKRACMVPNCSGCRAEADHYLAALAANPRALAEWAPPDVIDAVIDRAIRDGALVQPTIITPDCDDLAVFSPVSNGRGYVAPQAETEGAGSGWDDRTWVPLYRRAERSGTDG